MSLESDQRAIVLHVERVGVDRGRAEIDLDRLLRDHRAAFEVDIGGAHVDVIARFGADMTSSTSAAFPSAYRTARLRVHRDPALALHLNPRLQRLSSTCVGLRISWKAASALTS
jgi:hypothetical protein